MRKAFLPSDDSVLLSSDYSQIELRVLAHISESKELQEAFIHNEDIHKKVAKCVIFGLCGETPFLKKGSPRTPSEKLQTGGKTPAEPARVNR